MMRLIELQHGRPFAAWLKSELQRGRSVEQVAFTLGTSKQNVYRWAKREQVELPGRRG